MDLKDGSELLSYLFSLALWQINSTEKLKANANATACHIDWPLIKVTIIIIRQNKLTITVRAFFSEKYFFILSGLRGF
jgi:hypothetical protein